MTQAEISFHPVLWDWFVRTFGRPTDVQTRAWEHICRGEHTLIAAPTGSGKTLAALLPCLDRIVRMKEAGGWSKPGVRVLYVTPLKALNNDIGHHILRFAEGMAQTAEAASASWPGLTVGVRTGDTSQSTRASMIKSPPDLLVTTPESLYLMLTTHKAREMLRSAERIIVDEIHDLAADKRGLHLSLTLERLTELCGGTPQRIGVSATQKPMDRVARFLGGWEEANPARKTPDKDTDWAAEMKPRPVAIVESLMEKRFDVRVTLPEQGMKAFDKEVVWTPLVERMQRLMEGSRSVLVFVNNRRLCERLTLRLNDHAGYEMAKSHHGSVSKEKRLEAEGMLKSGGLRCLVATSTLELGIDVGHVDLVIQIDSPKQAAAGIQRIGRAGHNVGDPSRGAIVARSRGDLAEAAVLARAVAARDIEDIRMPRHALDVLAQQTVAAVAADDWAPGRLYRLFTRSDGYRGFPRERFTAMLEVLAGLYPFIRPRIGWDRTADRLHRLPATPMAAIMGAGTIPQSTSYPVHHAETRQHIGELDEEFVHESRVGDVFQLGASSWMIRSIRHDRVYVAQSANGYSDIPFWRAEAGSRSAELGRKVGAFLAELAAECRSGASPVAVQERLMNDYFMDPEAADALADYVKSQQASCGVPTDTLILAELFKDDINRQHLVVHSLFGRRINRTWETALRTRLDRIVPQPLYSVAKDDGIEFIFPEWDAAWLSELQRVTPDNVEELLAEAVPSTSMFGRAFRDIAETSLLLAKGFERIPAWKKRLRSEELLKQALPFADKFPFLREAFAECMETAFDVEGLKSLLHGIRTGIIGLKITETRAPSPFAARFTRDYVMIAMYESDAFGRDVQLRLLNVSREMAAEWFGRDGLRSMVTPEAVRAEALRLETGWRRGNGETGDSESLLRLLKEQGDLTEAEIADKAGSEAPALLRDLAAGERAAMVRISGETRWISRDEAAIYEDFPTDPSAAAFILKRYADRCLTFAPEEMAKRYGLPLPEIQTLLASWMEKGWIERAFFTEAEAEQSLGRSGTAEDRYTSSRVAERIVRFSIRDFRVKHEPVDPVRYAFRLAASHHLHPQYRLTGEEGLRTAVEQLQGMFLPLSHWESVIFPSRLADYRKETLDRLCAAGEILWLGRKVPEEKEGRIAFFPADNKSMYAPYLKTEEETRQPELLSLLLRRGASFLSALSRETGEPPSETLARLMDLVWEGRVSNDQFAPLRVKQGTGGAASGKGKPEFRSGLGRWYALVDREDGTESLEPSAVGYCKHWIEQFGILTRSVSALGIPFPWDRLTEVLKRLEDWGMVTRGYFVRDVPAMQFSTKEQVEVLQEAPAVGDGLLTLVSAADPANPFGILVNWPDLPCADFARKPGNFLAFQGSRWVYWIEHYGRHIVPLSREITDSGALKDIFKTILARHRLRKITVEKWNGTSAVDSEAAADLARMGGEKDRNAYVFWPSSLTQ